MDIQEINLDKVIDILKHAIPKSWHYNIVLQGYNPEETTLAELVDFCKQHEFVEANG
jgi:hypothetical protein